MIIHADILDWAASYDGEPFHAALMDAPYEMQFMGKDWDNTGVAFNPETWRLIARCLHPGAFLFVMAGTINDDLISVAMRQAGLRKYHRAAAWSYGSGFPKATRIDVAVDRRAGVERTKVGTRKHQPKFDAKGFEYRKKDNGFNSKDRATFDVTVPATDLAQAWAGHRYGGQMLKPALESILIFQKPYAGKPVDSITATGAGALNVDGGRIGNGNDRASGGLAQSISMFQGGAQEARPDGGRWPANFALVHHPACDRIGVRRVKSASGTNGIAKRETAGYQGGFGDRSAFVYTAPDGRETIADWSCHPDCVVRRLGEQSGESESKASPRGAVNIGTFGGTAGDVYGKRDWKDDYEVRGVSDSGTAARFFHQSDWMAERLEAADAVGYFAKASRGEREAGLDPRQIALLGMAGEEMEDFEGQPAQRAAPGDRKCQNCGGWYPKAQRAQRRPGSTCNCEEPDFVYVDFPQTTVDDGRQTPIDNPYQRGETTRRNTHPTIKPIALTRWLATLLLPPAMYAPRRLLIPFAGAGSEMVGAMLAGWEDVTGIELEADHVAIAEARLAYWQQRRWELLDPAAPITAKSSATVDGQRDMFMEEP